MLRPLWLVLLVLLALAFGPGQVEGSGCTLGLAAFKKNGQARTLQARPGQAKVFSVVVTNTGSTTLTNVAVKMALPEGLQRAWQTPAKKGQLVVQGNDVFWLGQTLAPRKARRFSIKTKVTACAGRTLEVNALAYLVGPSAEVFSCPTPAAVARVTVQQKGGATWGSKSNSKPCSTPAPTSQPSPDYNLYATGERCLEGVAVPAPGSVVDADACWKACSSGSSTPFYFATDPQADTCWCSNTCTLVYDPHAVTYKAEQLAPPPGLVCNGATIGDFVGCGAYTFCGMAWSPMGGSDVNTCLTNCANAGISNLIGAYYDPNEPVVQCYCFSPETEPYTASPASGELYFLTTNTQGVANSFPFGQCAAPSSCPDLYAWNGTAYNFETDLSGSGKMGMFTGTSFIRPQGYDWHVLDTAVAKRDGHYEMTLVEDREEANYLDQVRLSYVDVPENSTLRGIIVGFGMYGDKNMATVTRVVDAQPAPLTAKLIGLDGTLQGDVSAQVAAIGDNQQVLVGNENADDPLIGGLELDLGALGTASRRVLVYRGMTIFPITPTEERAREIGRRRINGQRQALQVWNGTAWTSPAGFTLNSLKGYYRTFALDLSGIVFPVANDHRIRIMNTLTCLYDYIALDTNAALASVPITAVDFPLASAELRYHGQVERVPLIPGTRAYTHPDYTQVITGGPYIPGTYTRYGDVKALVSTSDDLFAIWGTGDEVFMRFDATAEPPVPAGKVRQYVFMLNNFYKDMHNPLSINNVEPLPFFAMTAYPYNTSAEGYPTGEPYDSYRATYNTRVK